MNCLLITSVILLFSACSSGFDQDGLKMNQRIYENAVEIKDWDVARMAVFNILAIDSNNYDYYDTLANIYFKSKDYGPALKSCERALAFNENVKTTRLAFECSRILKDYPQMIHFGKYLETTDRINVQIKYEMAFALINQKNEAEAIIYLESIIQDQQSGSIFYKEYSGNAVQNVPYKASAYNLLGFIKSEFSFKAEAKQMFQMAVEAFPQYKLAQENLLLMEQMEQMKQVESKEN
ncbi:MAG: hypothetical protein JKY54_16325 [Flavobacteriales bacterium]|nr:hypothetical protein [Flavobacteriales bacterium]